MGVSEPSPASGYFVGNGSDVERGSAGIQIPFLRETKLINKLQQHYLTLIIDFLVSEMEKSLGVCT